MKYNFFCKTCGAEEEKEIPIKDYDEQKEKQVCSSCGVKMKRVIEWSGIATSSNNNGWCGKSGRNAI